MKRLQLFVSAMMLGEMQSAIPFGHLSRCWVVDQPSDRLMSPAKPSVIGADAETDAVEADAVADLAAGAETAVPAEAVTDDSEVSTATASIAAAKRREDLISLHDISFIIQSPF